MSCVAPGKIIPGGVGRLTIGFNTLDADPRQIGRAMADGRLAMKALLETGQTIAELEPGEHLADHDMCLRLHQSQIFERAGKDRELPGVFIGDRRPASPAMRALDARR